MAEQRAAPIGGIRMSHEVTGDPAAPPMVLLHDHLGLRDVILIGHSMGAVVAYLVVVARPDLVTRLITADAPPPFPRDRPVRGKPTGPIAFDRPVVLLITIPAGHHIHTTRPTEFQDSVLTGSPRPSSQKRSGTDFHSMKDFQLISCKSFIVSPVPRWWR